MESRTRSGRPLLRLHLDEASVLVLPTVSKFERIAPIRSETESWFLTLNTTACQPALGFGRSELMILAGNLDS